MLILQMSLVGVLAVFILQRPYLGIVFTAASLPVIDLLPPLPGLSSVVPLFGGLALFSFAWQRKIERKPLFRFSSVHTLGLLFIGWIFLSHPQAAWFNYDRSWLFTFIQLWVLLLLAGEMMDAPEKQHVFMWVYSGATVISALVAIQHGNIGGNVGSSTRALGLAEGANSAARYFVVAMVFLNYLRTTAYAPVLRLLAVSGTVITFLGVFFTVSRTGILLIFAVLGMLFLLSPDPKYRLQLIVISFFAIFGLLFLSDNVIRIVSTIMPSIVEGTDTAGLRYALWKAGWRMWLENPLAGVGIGMYPRQLRYFGQDLMAPIFWKGAVAHNTYIQVLAETGLIGFAMFALLLIKSLQNIWRSKAGANSETVALRNVWLIAFLAMLLGGITKTDYADKLIWLVMGVSVYFYRVSLETEQNAVKPSLSAFERESIGALIDDRVGRPVHGKP